MLLGHVSSWVMLRFWRLKGQSEVAYTYSGGIRNYTAGIVIAQLYFTPLASFPVLGAMLLQHPFALLVHILYKRTRERASRVESGIPLAEQHSG